MTTTTQTAVQITVHMCHSDFYKIRHIHSDYESAEDSVSTRKYEGKQKNFRTGKNEC